MLWLFFAIGSSCSQWRNRWCFLIFKRSPDYNEGEVIDMKNNSFDNKKIIFAYITLTVLALGAWYIVSQLSQPRDNVGGEVVTNMADSQLDNKLIEAGYSEEALNGMSEKEKEQAILSSQDERYEEAANRQYSSAANAAEYDEASSVKSYQEIMAIFELGEYNFAADQVNDILVRFNLSTETNMKLGNLLSDAYVMSSYESLNWEDKEMSLKSFKNPESFVIGVINAYPRRREVVIGDLNSLSPMSEGSVHILGTKLMDKDSAEYKNNSGYFPDTRNVYKVDFSYGEFDSLYAYVLESNDRVLRLSGIYTDKQYEFMRSVSWWIETGNDREKGV